MSRTGDRTTRGDDLNDLGGRRAVVLGATGGIGGAIVAELLARGAEVLAAGRNAERLGELARLGATPLPLDLADAAAPAELAAAARDAGGLDVFVAATGGYGPIGPTRSVDLAAVRASVDENLWAVLACLQAVAPLLDASPDPSVVLLSGGGATGPLPRYAAYSAAKVATVRLAEGLAAEEPGWRVNTVAPGFVATSIHDATAQAGPELAGRMFDQTRRDTEKAVPPERAAELVAFLAGAGAAGITGRLISAVWDPWATGELQAVLRDDPSFGRLRRVDGQRVVDAGG